MKHNQMSVLLLLLAGTALLASCGESAQTPAETGNAAETVQETAAPEESDILADPVPAKDFGGASFTVLASSTSTQHLQIAFNTQVGEVLDDAMYNRTKAVEEKFNIVFNDDYVPGVSDDANKALKDAVSAGEDAYQIALILERNAFSMTNEGYFYDIADLPQVDFTQPWWFSDVNETINLSDHYYLTYGSVNLGFYDFMHALLFNKQMIANLDLESPYDLVLSGDWTFDKMAEMARAARSDADGDGVWGTGDIYGFVGAPNTTVVDFLASSRVRMISVDEQKNVTVNLITDPKINEIYEKVCTTFWDPGFWYTKSGNSNSYYLTDTYFQTDQALFADHTLYTTGLLRDMKTDFGIVPFPKMDAAQDGYGTMVEAGTRAITVPTTIAAPELVGHVLETLNFLSYRDVTPVYYEITLKQKYSRDDISTKMLDIILDSVFYDLGDTMFNDLVKDGIFQPLLKANKHDYVSTATKKLSSIEKSIEKAKGITG